MRMIVFVVCVIINTKCVLFEWITTHLKHCLCVCVRISEWLKSATWSGSCRESGIWVETAQLAKPRRSAANQRPRFTWRSFTRPIKRSVTTWISHTPPTTSWGPTTTRLDQSQCLLFSTFVTSSLWGKLLCYLEGGDLSRAIRGSYQYQTLSKWPSSQMKIHWRQHEIQVHPLFFFFEYLSFKFATRILLFSSPRKQIFLFPLMSPWPKMILAYNLKPCISRSNQILMDNIKSPHYFLLNIHFHFKMSFF